MPVLGKTKQHVVSEFRCSEILAAAREVFARKGYNAATVDDIADRAGLAKGTVYLYFPSKREIYVETLRQGTIALQDEVQRSMEGQATAEEKVRAFIRTRIAYSERNRDCMRIYYTEFTNMLVYTAPAAQDFEDLYHQQAEALARVLDEGKRKSEIRPRDTSRTARMIYDMTRGLIAQRLLGWSQAPVDEDAEFLFDVIWKGVGC